jgi:uncharacterized membrane protein YidH (DUF202 family)
VLASSSAIGRAPPVVLIGVFLVVLGAYALVYRRSLTAAWARLTHHRDGGDPYARVFLIAATTMVVVGVVVLIAYRLQQGS